MTLEFRIDPEAYAEAEQWACEFLRDDCGAIGRRIVALFHESDYGASQIVDALAVNMLDRDAITVKDARRGHRGGPRSRLHGRKRGAPV